MFWPALNARANRIRQHLREALHLRCGVGRVDEAGAPDGGLESGHSYLLPRAAAPKYLWWFTLQSGRTRQNASSFRVQRYDHSGKIGKRSATRNARCFSDSGSAVSRAQHSNEGPFDRICCQQLTSDRLSAIRIRAGSPLCEDRPDRTMLVGAGLVNGRWLAEVGP
jgi:hypothetical protein